MSKYKGKNDETSVVRLASNRAKYAFEVFKKRGVRNVAVSDFNFSERVYYGRIDDEDDVVIPKPESLLRLDGSPMEMKLVLPFVKDMAGHLQGKFDQASLLGSVPDDDPYLAKIKVYNAYEDPMALYDSHLVDLIDTYNNSFLTVDRHAKSVMNFDSYNKHFFKFVKIIGRDFPITLTAFHKSKRSTIFGNAITISIADLDCSKDKDKEENFINKKCIDFYLNTAKQYGFHVTKNAPWILVADLGSVSTQVYLKKYGLSTPRQIFKEYYIKTYTLDIDLLSKKLQKGYNQFIDIRKFEKEFKVCNKYTTSNRLYRSKVNNNILYNKYNTKYWMPLYIDIRNWEEDQLYTPQEIQRMKEKSFSFLNLLDKDRSMRYINEQYRVKHKFAHGGMAYWYKRFKQRSEDR